MGAKGRGIIKNAGVRAETNSGLLPPFAQAGRQQARWASSGTRLHDAAPLAPHMPRPAAHRCRQVQLPRKVVKGELCKQVQTQCNPRRVPQVVDQQRLGLGSPQLRQLGRRGPTCTGQYGAVSAELLVFEQRLLHLLAVCRLRCDAYCERQRVAGHAQWYGAAAGQGRLEVRSQRPGLERNQGGFGLDDRLEVRAPPPDLRSEGRVPQGREAASVSTG